MAFQDRIRVVENLEVDAAWAKQFERLSGISWPPKDSAELTLILVRAGFTDDHIDQFFAGTLSGRAVSVSAEPGPVARASATRTGQTLDADRDVGWPTFSKRLIEGLRDTAPRQGRLSPAEQDIVDVIREAGGYLPSQDAVLDALAKKRKIPSEGTTKVLLAALVRHALLDNGPGGKGYALP